MPYTCFNDDGNAAVILATNLETGDVMPVCGECVVPYALTLLQSITGVTWMPEGGWQTNTDTGDATDEPEGADGPTVDAAPGENVPPGSPGAPEPYGVGENAEELTDPNPDWDVTPGEGSLTTAAPSG